MNTLQGLSDAVSRQFASVRETLRQIDEQFTREAPGIDRLIAQMDEWAARPLMADDAQSPQQRRLAYRATLWAQHGWFLSLWETPLSLISGTAESLSTDDGTLEAHIIHHFRRQVGKFRDTIISRHADRTRIIAEAFEAHIAGRYFLSIPVMLTQADGIASSFFGIDSIYTVSDANFLKIRDRFDACDTGILRMQSLQFLIGSLTPLNASRKKRQNYSRPFNRHAVIHGESTDYGTEVNSLKTISWLHFVSELLHEHI